MNVVTKICSTFDELRANLYHQSNNKSFGDFFALRLLFITIINNIIRAFLQMKFWLDSSFFNAVDTMDFQDYGYASGVFRYFKQLGQLLKIHSSPYFQPQLALHTPTYIYTI